MNRLSNIAIASMVFMLAGLSACVNDTADEQFPGEGVEKELWLDVVVPGGTKSKSSTRAITAAEENTIQTVDVIAFRIDGATETFDYWATATLAPGSTPGAARQTFTANLRTQSYQQRFVVITNAPQRVNETMTKSWRSASKAQVLADLIYNLASGQTGWNVASPTNYTRMPMWGESALETVTATTSNLTSTILMMRMLARVDVKLDTNVAGLTDQFKMRSVSLYNTNTGGNIVPDAARVVTEQRDGQPYLRVSSPTIPPELQPYSARSRGPIVYTDFSAPGVADVSIIGAIYTFEAAASTNASEATAIVVGGLYGTDTTPSYYRLELWRQDSTTERLDLLRNSQYVVNITSVRGRGHSTAEEAFVSQSVNMTANILAWNQPAMDNVVFDGQNVLATDKDQVNLFSNQYTAALVTGENAVQVRTDVPAGWTVSGITNADGTGPPVWIRVAPTSGTGNNANTQMVVSVDANTSGAARTAIVTLTAGRLRMPIRVNQSITPAIALNIVDGSNQEIQEIVFPSASGVAPEPRSFTVNWQPATNPVRVQAVQVGRYEFRNQGGNPAENNGAPYTNMPWPETNGTRTFTVSPSAIPQSEFDTDPFYERSSRFDMSVNNGQTTMTKSIFLRQWQYNLRAEESSTATGTTTPADATEPTRYAQLGGRQYTYNVRSNSPWIIRAINETRQVDTSVSLFGSQTAGDNVNVGARGQVAYTPSGGTRELFTTDNTRRGNSGYADIIYSSDPAGRFSDVRTRIFFPSAQFTIYGIVKMADPNANFYNIFAGQNRQVSTSTRAQHMHPMLNDARNYGTNLTGSGIDATPASTIFTSPVYVNGVNYNDGNNLTVADINDAVTAGADMLFISGSTRFDQTVGQAIFDNFLARQKPVMLAVEDPATIIAALRPILTGSGTQLYNSQGTMNGTAPVYQFRDIPGDPILQGPFGDLRNQHWGCDGNGSIAYWFSIRTNIISYANAVNQSGDTDNPPAGLTQASGTTMADGMTCFRIISHPLIFVADGGFAGAFNQTATDRGPALINTTTNYPAPRPNYGGGATKRNTWNAYFIANTVAWAIQRRTTQ